MEHRYLVANPHALVQQLALLARTGFYFWTSGVVADDRDPLDFDRMLAERYGLGRSKYQDYRRSKRHGLSKMKYLRLGRSWWLLVTESDNRDPVFQQEQFRDLRKTPVLASGYAVALYEGKVSVRIERDMYRLMKEKFGKVAVGASATWLERMFWRLPFEPWFGVYQQTLQLFAFVNQQRKKAGLIQLDKDRALREKKRTFKVFVSGTEQG